MFTKRATQISKIFLEVINLNILKEEVYMVKSSRDCNFISTDKLMLGCLYHLKNQTRGGPK